MPDSLCRLTIQHDGGDHAVDLALPRKLSVGELMPSIHDILLQDTSPPVAGGRWRLARIGGPPLDESLSLEDNEVRDGELLLLSSVDTTAPAWVVIDPSHTAAQIVDDSGGSLTPTLPALCCVLVSVIVAAALIWTATGPARAGSLITGALLAVGAAAGAVVSWRSHRDTSLCVPLSFASVIFAAAVGFLAVPAGPLATHVLLASAAVFSATIVHLRLTRCGTATLMAAATTAALTAAATVAVVMWQLPTTAAGASLATLALGALGVAPRLAIMISGIGPPVPDLDDQGQQLQVLTSARAALAHRVLTGLVAGSSVAAVLGAGTVAIGLLRDGGPVLIGGIFTTLIGVVLLLRMRVYADAIRRAVLAIGGIVSATPGLALGVVSAPSHAHWLSGVAAVTGAAALSRYMGITVGPVVRRTVEVGEYLALAAVVPMACWVAGVYGAVRGSGLP